MPLIDRLIDLGLAGALDLSAFLLRADIRGWTALHDAIYHDRWSVLQRLFLLIFDLLVGGKIDGPGLMDDCDTTILVLLNYFKDKIHGVLRKYWGVASVHIDAAGISADMPIWRTSAAASSLPWHASVCKLDEITGVVRSLATALSIAFDKRGIAVYYYDGLQMCKEWSTAEARRSGDFGPLLLHIKRLGPEAGFDANHLLEVEDHVDDRLDLTVAALKGSGDGGDDDDDDDDGIAELQMAAENGNLEVVRRLLARGTSDGGEPYEAAVYGQALIAAATSSWGWKSAAHGSRFRSSKLRIARLLIEKGLADVNFADPLSCCTPLSEAARHDSLAMVMLLHKHGGNVNDHLSCTPLSEAARYDSLEMVMQHGGNHRLGREHVIESVLSLAGSRRMTELLTGLGATMTTAEENEKKTKKGGPLVRRTNYKPLVANVDSSDEGALFDAIFSGNLVKVKALLASGRIDLNAARLPVPEGLQKVRRLVRKRFSAFSPRCYPFVLCLYSFRSKGSNSSGALIRSSWPCLLGTVRFGRCQFCPRFLSRRTTPTGVLQCSIRTHSTTLKSSKS